MFRRDVSLFPMKGLFLKRLILFISFQVMKDPMFLCAFDCTTYTANVSSRDTVFVFVISNVNF